VQTAAKSLFPFTLLGVTPDNQRPSPDQQGTCTSPKIRLHVSFQGQFNGQTTAPIDFTNIANGINKPRINKSKHTRKRKPFRAIRDHQQPRASRLELFLFWLFLSDRQAALPPISTHHPQLISSLGPPWDPLPIKHHGSMTRTR